MKRRQRVEPTQRKKWRRNNKKKVSTENRELNRGKKNAVLTKGLGRGKETP